MRRTYSPSATFQARFLDSELAAALATDSEHEFVVAYGVSRDHTICRLYAVLKHADASPGSLSHQQVELDTAMAALFASILDGMGSTFQSSALTNFVLMEMHRPQRLRKLHFLRRVISRTLAAMLEADEALEI